MEVLDMVMFWEQVQTAQVSRLQLFSDNITSINKSNFSGVHCQIQKYKKETSL